MEPGAYAQQPKRRADEAIDMHSSKEPRIDGVQQSRMPQQHVAPHMLMTPCLEETMPIMAGGAHAQDHQNADQEVEDVERLQTDEQIGQEAAVMGAQNGEGHRVGRADDADMQAVHHKWGETGGNFKTGKFSKRESELIVAAINDYAAKHAIPTDVSFWGHDGLAHSRQ